MLKQLYPVLLVFFIGIVGLALAVYFLLRGESEIKVAEPEPPRLSLPLDCELGESCFLQNYVDIDPGPGRRDYACGEATYDGHKGTDFRVLSVRAADGVRVLAVADGDVLRVRDGMPEKLVRDYSSEMEMKSVIAGRDCGNGLVLDHGDGWTTQYCHMKPESLLVSPGQRVRRGAELGLVGYSGRADFAHVHVTVRKGEEVIDPFTGRGQDNNCGLNQDASAGLWQATLRDKMRYGANIFIGAGFSGTPPDPKGFEHDHRVAPLAPDSQALVFYVRMANLQVSDRVRISVRGPAGFEADHTTKPLKSSKAVQVIYVGRKLKDARWPAGQYSGNAAIIRRGPDGTAGKVADTRKVVFDMP